MNSVVAFGMVGLQLIQALRPSLLAIVESLVAFSFGRTCSSWRPRSCISSYWYVKIRFFSGRILTTFVSCWVLVPSLEGVGVDNNGMFGLHILVVENFALEETCVHSVRRKR